MLNPSSTFASLPKGLRDPLVERYAEICRNYSERRWEPAELNGGKFSEVVYAVVHGAITGSYPSVLSKPANIVDACRALEKHPAAASRTGDRSLRILIPRALITLYEIRSNRGVGHIGGDVNPNHMDATVVFSLASWVMAELVRIFHNLAPPDAQTVVDALVERKLPLIWEIEGVKRVLDPNLSTRNQVLLLLYSHAGWVSEKDLIRSVEYSGSSMFRKRLLVPLHQERLVEFDEQQGRVMISPRGVSEVEKGLLPSLKVA